MKKTNRTKSSLRPPYPVTTCGKKNSTFLRRIFILKFYPPSAPVEIISMSIKLFPTATLRQSKMATSCFSDFSLKTPARGVASDIIARKRALRTGLPRSPQTQDGAPNCVVKNAGGHLCVATVFCL